MSSMKIKWLQDTPLTIIVGFDEDDDDCPIEEEDMFDKDSISEVEIIDDDGDTFNIQFGDGSMAYGVSTTLFEVMEMF